MSARPLTWGLRRLELELEALRAGFDGVLSETHIDEDARWEATRGRVSDEAFASGRKSVRRAYARDQAANSTASDALKVERHLRKLARSLAVTRRRELTVSFPGDVAPTVTIWPVVIDELVRKRVNGVDVEQRRPIKYVRTVVRPLERTVVDVELDEATGELTETYRHKPGFTRRKVVGYYEGGNGFLSVNDGRVSADSIRRLLGGAVFDPELVDWT